MGVGPLRKAVLELQQLEGRLLRRVDERLTDAQQVSEPRRLSCHLSTHAIHVSVVHDVIAHRRSRCVQDAMQRASHADLLRERRDGIYLDMLRSEISTLCGTVSRCMVCIRAVACAHLSAARAPLVPRCLADAG